MGLLGSFPSYAFNCSSVNGSSFGGARSVFSGDITLLGSSSVFSSDALAELTVGVGRRDDGLDEL